MAKSGLDYPFAAIVGQDALKQALIQCAIDPSLGGVLAIGDRGTGKTTAVRGLASLLPNLTAVSGCRYNCDPDTTDHQCKSCASKRKKETVEVSAPVVDLPLGVTEDRLIGSLDIEKALVDGSREFEPGLLADANRGFLYIDEVNLLEDHLVDVLLDVAASGWNVVEREGMSVRHPAKFVLVGSGNPEEGELRPQLMDRFGLSVDVETPTEIKARVEVIRRRDAFDRDRKAFIQKWKRETNKLAKRIVHARELLNHIEIEDSCMELIAEICVALGTDGLRGELTLIKSARAFAAWNGNTKVSESDIRAMAPFALGHRLRRNPLDDARATVRVERVLEEIFTARTAA